MRTANFHERAPLPCIVHGHLYYPGAKRTCLPWPHALRCSTILGHLTQRAAAATVDPDDEIVIVTALRTPIGRAKRYVSTALDARPCLARPTRSHLTHCRSSGAFAHTPADELLSTVLKGVTDAAGLPASKVEDVCVGNVLLENFAVNARGSQFLAGFPSDVSVTTVNRQCSSGLQVGGRLLAAALVAVCLGHTLAVLRVHRLRRLPGCRPLSTLRASFKVG